MKEYSINAENRPLGRVASQVALALRGKNSPDFQPHIAPKVKVKISNLSKIKLTGNKMKEKTYKRYSGYPGGLKTVSFQSMFEKDPEGAFKNVVRGMLPGNKLRKGMLKNIVFE